MKRKITKAEFDALHVEIQKLYTQDGEKYVLQLADEEDELSHLRKANSELTEKAKNRKEKIAELEGNFAAVQAKLAASEAALHSALVDVPVQEIAKSISPVPDIFLAEFGKFYRVDRDKDGKFAILNVADGKPAIDEKSGKPFAFEHQDLIRLLANGEDDRSKRFAHLLTGSRASGGISAAQVRVNSSNNEPKREKAAFGLR